MATKDLETQLLDLERKYWKAIKEKDVEAALKLSDDPCIVTGAQGVGVINHESMAAMMQQASYTLNDFSLEEGAEVRMLGDDVAIVAYKVHEDLTVEGKPVALDAAESSTWVRRDGEWVCAMHSEALTGDPFGRDRRAGR
jgi:ketosteroid isomerase-like protein